MRVTLVGSDETMVDPIETTCLHPRAVHKASCIHSFILA